MNLIIVESPTKAKTLNRFLGSGYAVHSSFGHVRDLPKSKLGVDVQKNFQPQYVIPAKAKKVIAALKTEAKKVQTIILATDADREGEAISWHLTQALGLNKRKVTIERIVFHEITERAVKTALARPRPIDMNLVDAQQARRILDRLVGYELSPFLWKKVRAGLSAGRVQSVAVRLVVEREREIKNFLPQEYWSIEAELKTTAGSIFRAKLFKVNQQILDRLEIKNQEQAKKILSALQSADYRVDNLETKTLTRHPAPPFTTSTLQQEAARQLGFSAKQTMLTAQRLYENGQITYMRTDSVNLSPEALVQAQILIKKQFGPHYSQTRQYTTKTKRAQEAHEAIRPTRWEKSAEQLALLEQGQKKLYELIWKRALASQMSPALFNQTVAEIATGTPYAFRASGQTLKFDGFLRLYREGRDEPEEENDHQLPPLSKDEKLNLQKLEPLQHFTEPPPRFTDATLVKTLEMHGIGRPSTYAPILSTIQDRGYVEKTEKKYHPTEIGLLVNDLLVENFPVIVDINFTSHIEDQLDEIAEGKLEWVPVIKEFYTPFKKNLEEKRVTVEKTQTLTDIPCPTCRQPMAERFGRQGKFLVCSDPECKTTKPTPEEEKIVNQLEEKTKDEKCPQCGGTMTVKRGRFGYFLGCARYPECKGIAKIQNKIGFKCPHCQARQKPGLTEEQIGEIVEKKSRLRGKIFYGCNRYPECNFLINLVPRDESELEQWYLEWKNKSSAAKKREKSKIKK